MKKGPLQCSDEGFIKHTINPQSCEQLTLLFWFWSDIEIQKDGLAVNTSRVCSSKPNPITGSIYSFDGVISVMYEPTN